MSMRSDPAVVFDHRPAIDDAVLADDRTSVDDNPWHDDCSSADARRGRNDGTRMNKGRWQESVLNRQAEVLSPLAVVTNGYDKVASGKVTQPLDPAYDLTLTKARAAFGGVVVQKHDASETTHASSHIPDNFPVSASTPDKQCGVVRRQCHGRDQSLLQPQDPRWRLSKASQCTQSPDRPGMRKLLSSGCGSNARRGVSS